MKKISLFLLVIMCLFITDCGKENNDEQKNNDADKNIDKTYNQKE